jgi:putative component of toxin-antitoxin plasmid stabilization module
VLNVQRIIYHSFGVIFKVFTAEDMKITIVWFVALCRHVEIDRRFRGAYCLHQGDKCPHDGGNMNLRNAGQSVRDYTAQQPTRLVIYYCLVDRNAKTRVERASRRHSSLCVISKLITCTKPHTVLKYNQFWK